MKPEEIGVGLQNLLNNRSAHLSPAEQEFLLKVIEHSKAAELPVAYRYLNGRGKHNFFGFCDTVATEALEIAEPLYLGPNACVAQMTSKEAFRELLLQWWQNGMEDAEFFNRAAKLLGVTSEEYFSFEGCPTINTSEVPCSQKLRTLDAGARPILAADVNGVLEDVAVGLEKFYGRKRRLDVGDIADSIRVLKVLPAQ